MLHTLCNHEVTMKEEKECGQGRVTWRHDSVLFAIFCTVYTAVLQFKKEHQQVKLGVSEEEVNKTIQFKTESHAKYRKSARHCDKCC